MESVCTENLDQEIEELIQRGYKLLIPAKEAAFNNRRVAFLMSLAVGMVELLEEEA